MTSDQFSIFDLLNSNRPAWQADALCVEYPPDMFFPEHGGHGTLGTEKARKICNGCLVREECLEYALEHHEVFGVWGGTSQRERRKIAKKRREEAGIVRLRTVTGQSVECGSDTKYKYGCRCQPCADAHRDHNREWRARQREALA